MLRIINLSFEFYIIFVPKTKIMKPTFLLILSLFLFFNIYSQENRLDFDKLQDSSLSADSVIVLIKNQKYSEPDKRGLFYLTNKCADDTVREFSVYIPKSYSPEKKIPLFVYLHGGVATRNLEPDSSWFEYLDFLPWMKMADKENFICLFPKAQYSAMWWDTVGSANILSQIRILKQQYNIDDSKVYLNGFSDGASGNYFMAMTHPTDFACFNAYNGYPAVGSFRKSTPTYFVNLQNSTMKSINTDIDGLYPSGKMIPIVKFAQLAGANIFYRVYTGVRHRMTYIDKELPIAVKFLEENPRNRFPSKIVWETVSPKQGRFNWLEITETDTLQEKKEWHKAYNMKFVEDRLSFGFMNDKEYKGKGIRMARIVGGICQELNLHAGDIFTKIDTVDIYGMEDMLRYKKTAKRGDSVRFEINRNDTILIFNTKFPDPEYFDIFNYNQKSGQIRGEYIANTFYIETSRVKRFSIYIHPDMVQLDQKVKVILNDKEVFSDFIEKDKDFIIENYRTNRDKELLYINKIDIEL